MHGRNVVLREQEEPRHQRPKADCYRIGNTVRVADERLDVSIRGVGGDLYIQLLRADVVNGRRLTMDGYTHAIQALGQLTVHDIRRVPGASGLGQVVAE